VEQGTISVRSRLDGDLGVMPVDSLIERLRTEVAQKRSKA
jgi:threonyl-tRNA synthetase